MMSEAQRKGESQRPHFPADTCRFIESHLEHTLGHWPTARSLPLSAFYRAESLPVKARRQYFSLWALGLLPTYPQAGAELAESPLVLYKEIHTS